MAGLDISSVVALLRQAMPRIESYAEMGRLIEDSRDEALSASAAIGAHYLVARLRP